MTQPHDPEDDTLMAPAGPGRVLAGRYDIGQVLGSGGMATVFEAHDLVLDRSVAVKVLSAHYASDPMFLARFTREAQHAARLSHPGLVTVFDTGVDHGTAFIVMELVRGNTLRELLMTRGCLPIPQAVTIATAVAEVLDVAHRAGIVHRDIKPGNILVSDDGRIRVFDFGIARTDGADPLTRTTTVIGTASYISPEQAAGHKAGPLSDLYSLGCVLVEMLTAAPPFTADHPIALLYKHIHEQPAPPSKSRAQIPATLDRVALRLLAKDPADRPASAAQARRELQAALTDQPADTRLLPALPQGQATASRSRWTTRQVVATAIVSAFLALLVFLAWQHLGRSSGAPRATPPPTPTVSISSGPVRAPTASSSPTAETPIGIPTAATPRGAIAALRTVITEGQTAGLITPSAASQLSQAADDTAAALNKGHGKPERSKVGELQNLVQNLTGQGQITGSAVTALNQALAQLSELISHKD